MKNLFLKTLMLFAVFIFATNAKAQFTISLFDDNGGNLCQGGVDVLVATAVGGTTPYSYTFYDGTTIVQGPSSSNTFTFDNTTGSNTLGIHNMSVVITDGSSNSLTANLNVNVVSSGGALPSAIPSITTICPYDTVNVSLGANTGTAYNYSYPCASNTSPCPISFSSSTPITYSMELTNTSGTCWTDAYFTINPYTPTTCSSLPALGVTVITSQSQIPSGNFSINTDIAIATGANITFSAQEIQMAPGVQILVRPGATLNVIGSWMHSCNCMWKGILATGNAAVNITTASVIEDAIYAVTTEVNSTASININHTLFNKNNIAINIKANTNNLSNTIHINDNIFTCRNFSSISTYQNLANYNTLLLNFINNWDTYPAANFPEGLTKYSHRSNVGVMLDGYTGPQIKIGDAATNGTLWSNVFDYLNYGVLTNNSNLFVCSNQFQNMSGNGFVTPTNPSTTGPIEGLNCRGAGVYGIVTDFINYSITIGSTVGARKNNFFNVLRGIDLYNYRDIKIQQDNFTSNYTDLMSDFYSSGGNFLGEVGVQITYLKTKPATTTLPNIDISFNYFQDYATGIHIIRQYFEAQFIKINCNEMNPALHVNYTNRYMNQGISLEDLPGLSGGNMPGNGYAISNNTVRYAKTNCIFAHNILTGLFIFKNGDITPFTPASCSGELSVDAGTSSNPNACIYALNCRNGNILCNEKIHGQYTGSTLQNNVHGILIEHSSNMYVQGNRLGEPTCVPVPPPVPPAPPLQLVALNYGITFKSACIPSIFNDCAFYNCYQAYRLEGSTIGDQLSSSSPGPRHFDWSPANNIHFQTYNDGSPDPNLPGNARLYLRTNSIPIANQGTGVSCGSAGMPYTTSFCGTNVGLINAAPSGGFYLGCATIVGGSQPFCPDPHKHPCTVSVPSDCGPIHPFASFDTLAISFTKLRQMLGDVDTTSLFGAERVWYNRRALYDHMLNSNLFPSAPADLQAFYLDAQNTGAGRFPQVDLAIANHDLTSATSLNNFTPSNNIETKLQQVNTVKIKMADTTSGVHVTATDINLLKSIANGCPDTDGPALDEARVALNLLYAQSLVYTSTCSGGNQYRKAQTNNTEKILGQSPSNINLYPNPNNGNFIVTFEGKGNKLTMEVYNSLGALVLNKQFPIENYQVNAEINNFSEGLYVIKFAIDGVPVKSHRVIVAK